MKTVIRFLTLAAVLASGATAAQAGACYRKVATPPVYGTFAKQVLVCPAKTHIYKVPATSRTVHRTVMVRPAQRIAHHVPAVTQTVAERVMVHPPGKVWSVTRDSRGNEVGCWVRRPAVYATRHRTVIVRPAAIRYSVVPAEYRTIAERVVVSPARLVEKVVPAVYATRHYRAVVAPGRVGWRPINPNCK